jgi:hypothetical protein
MSNPVPIRRQTMIVRVIGDQERKPGPDDRHERPKAM